MCVCVHVCVLVATAAVFDSKNSGIMMAVRVVMAVVIIMTVLIGSKVRTGW